MVLFLTYFNNQHKQKLIQFDNANFEYCFLYFLTKIFNKFKIEGCNLFYYTNNGFY